MKKLVYKRIGIQGIVCFSLLLSMYSTRAQQLNEYLEIALKNSPELKAKQFEYEGLLQKKIAVGSLPDTKIAAGYFVQETETRVGAQQAKLSISQSLPWFGTLAAKKESIGFRAAAQQNKVDAYKRQLVLNVKKSYYNLYEQQAIIEILKENIEILKTYEALALNELQNNRSTMVDVLKIKIETNELKNKLVVMEQSFLNKKRMFNLLLNRDLRALIIISGEIGSSDVEYVLDEKLLSNNPQLLQFDNLNNAVVKAEEVTKKEGLPKIGIGLDYVFVSERDVVNLADNGKDIIMPMVSVSIPLFSKKYSAKQKQLQLQQKTVLASKVEAKNALYQEYEKAVTALKNAKATIATQKINIEHAEQAHKVLLTAYETAKMDYTQILEIQKFKIKFETQEVASQKEYFFQKAIITYLIEE